MKVSKAIKKIEKALGVKVTRDGRNDNKYYAKYYFTYGNYVGSFLTQQAYGEDADEAYAHNWHIRRSNDHSDMMADYFAGSFYSNCTQMIHYLKPPPPKFPIGSLVRGKENKRGVRMGTAGAVGLVVGQLGTWGVMEIIYAGEEQISQAIERDFESCAD